CHLPPDQIAQDKKFSDLTGIWLDGDHYKWRAMRTNGVDEKYCTGDADNYSKFEKWAGTVPYTIRNPLYHWTHLELRRYFGIEKLLGPDSAREIYDTCSTMLHQDNFSARNILKKMNVEVVCTTDDPVDSLQHHRKIAEDGFEVKVLPAFRPDRVLQIEDPGSFKAYVQKLEKAADVSVQSLDDLLDALQKRHDYFHEMGCRLSDHGLAVTYAADFTRQEVDNIFDRAMVNKRLTHEEVLKYKSAMLVYLAHMDHEKDWVQQYHIGALRNNNERLFRELGPDTGFDSIGDFNIAASLSKFLSRLDNSDQLARTILYNLNPSDNEVIATMTGNFNDGRIPGKVQFGAAWWFLDQKDGMERQLNTLSNMGLITRFVGMLTDSRSFLSYPRHEYFRRILCNLFGRDVENGELPESELSWIAEMVRNICYNNARNYFNF
ncbi:MAG: glucuronate isomerase, partial [Cyclobacteriaceae bacterium]